MRVLLLTPPMTQINTPYPATTYLTGFLKEKGYEVEQADFSIELALRLFSKEGIEKIFSALKKNMPSKTEYQRTIDPVIRFLQGKDPTLAHRIITRTYLPEGSRFRTLDENQDSIGWAFGALGIQDQAKHLASLYLDDLVDLIRNHIDPHFEFSRYAEKLAASNPSFDPILERLSEPPSLIDQELDALTQKIISEKNPDVVGLSLPFPGNVYGGFRIAKTIKEMRPKLPILTGGGYVNTELRELKDPRVFDFFDYITFDDGERPILSILENLSDKKSAPRFLRTLVRENAKVVFKTDSSLHDIPFSETGTPSYQGLPIDQYLSLCELLNPMHRLWSDGRWNKLTLAHGCYWKKCSFCDTSLDYIGRYEPLAANPLIKKIETLIKETGQRGFHFVDEAAPPQLLSRLAQSLLEKEIDITWWGNIRFEKTFDSKLTHLLASSGCIAVSGGLEVASDRLLKLMQKGVTVEQVAQVTNAFTQSGIMVHAYLMYGFPSQTPQETIDSLERVRQLFAAGCIQSAFWHRFSVTTHSPIGKNPKAYGLEITPSESTFAKNDLTFEDSTGVDHSLFHEGLKKAVYNFMHGVGLDYDVRFWFDFPVPKAKVAKNLISKALKKS